MDSSQSQLDEDGVFEACPECDDESGIYRSWAKPEIRCDYHRGYIDGWQAKAADID